MEQKISSEEMCEKKKLKESKEKKSKLINKHQIIVNGPHIILDMNWSHFMNENQMSNVITQITFFYAANKKAIKSLPIICTSVDRIWDSLFNEEKRPNWDQKYITFTEQSFLDIIPHDKLVYLSPDSKNFCSEFNPEKYYIVGCFIDHNSHKNATENWAKKYGIQTEAFPISQYITKEGSFTLPINQSCEIILKRVNGESWVQTFMETISPRFNPQPIKQADPPKSVFSICQIS